MMSLNHLIHNGSFTLPDATEHHPPDLRLMPVNLSIKISVDLNSCAADATVVHTIEAQSNTAVSFKLDAIDLTILTVSDLNQHDVEWNYDGEVITIQWTKPFKKLEKRQISIQYQVIKPIAGMMFSGPKEIGQWMATDHETQRARYWLPCIDHSIVRTPVDVQITHKSELTCLGPGKKLSVKPASEGYSTTHWQLEQPCPSYLLCIVVGDLTEWHGESFHGAPIAAFAPKPTPVATLERCFKPTHDFLQLLTSKLGPLPWPKYYQFAVPGIGGAMENISLVSWDTFWMFDKIMHDDWGYLFDQINVHEMAHTWFGDLVVCRDYSHSWLKESWATYMEVIWFEEAHSIEDMHFELLTKRQLYFNEVKTSYSRPIVTRRYDSPWSMYDRHLYPGGAVRLHMLRNQLGDDVFWEAVRKYIHRFAQLTVETHDFRQMLEQESGQSLTRFFDQWLYRAGYPKLKIDFKHHLDTKIGKFDICHSLIGGSEGDDLFQFPLDIRLQRSNGEWETHTLLIENERHMLRLQMETAPLQIIIDPECIAVAAFDFNPGQTILNKTLTNSPTVHGRIQAAVSLAKTGKRININSIRDAFVNESHWGVKSAFADVLGKAKTPDAGAAIIDLMSVETDSRVKHALTAACSHHCSDSMRKAILHELNKDAIPYRAHRNLLLALAKHRNNEDFTHLAEAAKDNGWWQFIRTSAYTAMSECDSEKVYPFLIDEIHKEDMSPQAKAAATVSLGKTADKLKPHLKSRAIEQLNALLFDKAKRVKLAALQAVTAIGNPSSISHLEGLFGSHAKQDHPKIKRAIKACRQPKQNAAAKNWTNKIEKMQNEITTLKGRVLDLEAQIEISKRMT